MLTQRPQRSASTNILPEYQEMAKFCTDHILLTMPLLVHTRDKSNSHYTIDYEMDVIIKNQDTEERYVIERLHLQRSNKLEFKFPTNSKNNYYKIHLYQNLLTMPCEWIENFSNRPNNVDIREKIIFGINFWSKGTRYPQVRRAKLKFLSKMASNHVKDVRPGMELNLCADENCNLVQLKENKEIWFETLK